MEFVFYAFCMRVFGNCCQSGVNVKCTGLWAKHLCLYTYIYEIWNASLYTHIASGKKKKQNRNTEFCGITSNFLKVEHREKIAAEERNEKVK